MQNRPNILSIAGHDPTGGAGIQADIETISALGGRAFSLISALTSQNSSNLFSLKPVETELLERQFQLLTEDIKFDAVKVGLLGSIDMVHLLKKFLQKLSGIPIIIDPVLAAGGGQSVANKALIETFNSQILPLTTLLTPNIPEARLLTKLADPDDCARQLQDLGCKHILITGTHEETDNVVNRLYYSTNEKLFLEAKRLPYQYHGSGCTLSSAIATYLARHFSLTDAVKLAQEFTFESLKQAEKPGHGQYLPLRCRKT
jgi:hydroxymethylpyrimidine/phosphomethylpyrimidine kinase